MNVLFPLTSILGRRRRKAEPARRAGRLPNAPENLREYCGLSPRRPCGRFGKEPHTGITAQVLFKAINAHKRKAVANG